MLTRRELSKLILSLGTAVFGPESIWAAGKPPDPGQHSLAGVEQGASQKCELLIKGGTVIDPAQSLHAPLDVAVKDGKILEVSRDFPEAQARSVISAKGKIVTSGLIDCHVHCFDGVGLSGVNADHCCLGRGVTTVVDAGSAGFTSISGLRKHIIKPSATRIYALVDIGALGLIVGLKDSLSNLEWLNPQLVAEAAEENRPAVVGIKVRLSEAATGAKDLECLKRALDAAEACHLPLMVHIAAPYSPLPDILRMLRKGDIFTHFLNGERHGVLDERGKVLPEVLEARHRGIIFDPAQGLVNFSFRVAETCLQQGLLPDTISTDLSRWVVDGPVFDLPTMISKFLALGMTIDKAIELTTINPARIFNYGADLGTLRPGSEADIAVFELRDGTYEFFDSSGEKRVGRQKLVNKAAVRGGEVFVNEA
ncbi:MAG: amidohydrolase/deacetylase family metallohydrolase [Terriglobia bacterium]